MFNHYDNVNYYDVARDLGIDVHVFVQLPKLYQDTLICKYLKKNYYEVKKNKFNVNDIDNIDNNVLKKILVRFKRK